MLNQRLLSALLVLLAAVLVGCGGQEVIYVTVTPGASPTPTQETATWTPAPTATIEPTATVPDGEIYYYPLNDNDEMLAARVERLYPDADGIFRRHQCIPSGMAFRWEPRAYGPQVPPWVDCDLDHRFGGLHIVHISDIDGEMYWRVPAEQVVPDRCYILKIVMENETILRDGADEALFGVGWLYPLDSVGAAIKLPAQPFPRDDDVEIFWPIMTDREIAVLEFEVGFAVNWAVYQGNIEVDQITIEQTRLSDGFCDLPITTHW